MNKLSILIMRDNSKVRRIRIHPFVIRFLLYMFIVLMIGAGVSIYGGMYFWKENKNLSENIHIIQKKLQLTTIELKRLQNMELLREDHMMDISSVFNSSQKDVYQHEGERNINLNHILGNIDQHILVANNVQIKFIGKKIKISFDINKSDHSNQDIIKGDVKMHFVLINGDIVKIESKKEMFFELRNMKKYNIRIPLSDSYSKDDIFGLRITINYPKNETVFCETYPLTDILL